MRYQTVEYCRAEDCQCDDTRGVILYDGPDRQAAEDAKCEARYDNIEITTIG